MVSRSTRCASVALAFVIAISGVATQPLQSAFASQAAQESPIPITPPKPEWPEVADRLNRPRHTMSNDAAPISQASPEVASLEPNAPNALQADATLVIPSEASRAANNKVALSLPAQGSTLKAQVEYLSQALPEDESAGGALSSMNVLFKFDMDAASKGKPRRSLSPFASPWTTAPCRSFDKFSMAAITRSV